MKTKYEVGDMAIIVRYDKYKGDKSQNNIGELVCITTAGSLTRAPQVLIADDRIFTQDSVFTCDVNELFPIEKYIEVIDMNLDKLIDKYGKR